MVSSGNPPLRVPLGNDTVTTIGAKNSFMAAEIARLRDLAVGTDFAA